MRPSSGGGGPRWPPTPGFVDLNGGGREFRLHPPFLPGGEAYGHAALLVQRTGEWYLGQVRVPPGAPKKPPRAPWTPARAPGSASMGREGVF